MAKAIVPFLSDIFSDPALDEKQMQRKANLFVEAVNHSLRGFEPERIRFHTCYGINDGPRLYEATRSCLVEWIDRLRAEAGDAFPRKITAFHPEMAAHGKFGEPCPQCGTPIQRIVYASRETNYCPECQTGGKLLADRALSRILREDWPRTLEELEELRSTAGGGSS